ncbi:TetR/AcrR family transcriptional regulator [Microbacterium sp. 4R-513]|uniref:TetR/AcrR family transcriptional regulator n=1 Tax=Microbacterium sp. 4R-513 TaxID=2567934 RepID=UPI0013E1745E|nr:TetR-like C-terminal domain-containing protein [Microbacterium sp. 4R-513]QIG39664.1 TetR/AcrR family transcriptional regulator [Microbacterium sp. 4R-513]
MPRSTAARADRDRPTYHHGNLREALITAGLELTRTGGPDALSLRDATRRVGVSPNAAYRHFADREALLAAIAARIQQGMAERMRGFTSPAPAHLTPARAALRAVGLGYIAFARREPGWFEVAFGNADAVPAVEPGAMPPPLAMLVSALDGLVAWGELDAAARPGAEWPCWSAVHGFALLALTGPLRGLPATDVDAAAERTVDAIIAGLLD